MNKIKLKDTVFPLLIVIFGLLSMIYKPDPAHDLFRYYEEAERMNLNNSFLAVIDYYYSQSSDFLYFLVFYIARLIGMPIWIVNGFFVCLFYYASSQIVLDLARWKGNVSKKDINIALIFMFCSTPFIFVFSISRNAAALAFLYLALHSFFQKSIIKTVLLLLLAVATHIGIALYIAMIAMGIAVSWLLQRFKIKKGFTFIAILLVFFILYMLKDGLNLILQLSFFDTFHYFARYIENTGLVSLADANLGGITTITLLWVVFIVTILAFGVDFSYPYSFILFVLPFLYVSFFMNNMFVQRTLMFMVPFNGCLLLGAQGKLSQEVRSILTAISVFLNCSILVAINRCFI